jgi:hypothetical protein
MSKANGSALVGSDLRQYWNENYPGCPPVGYMLRQKFRTSWFRIHTLPEAKRYAETNQEESEILRRHNSLLSSIQGNGDNYVLITTGYSDSVTPVRSYPQLEPIIGPSEHWLTVPLHELEEESDPNYWHFFFSEKTWTAQSANKLLRFVADGVVSNVLFLSMKKNCIYHPYDGGADIFVTSESLRNSLKQEYQSWLSSHPEGL